MIIQNKNLFVIEKLEVVLYSINKRDIHSGRLSKKAKRLQS